MKNITVSVDGDLYHQARVYAAQKKTSVSALVKQFLAAVVREESDFERLKREENELRSRIASEGITFSASDRLSRTDLHERHALR